MLYVSCSVLFQLNVFFDQRTIYSFKLYQKSKFNRWETQPKISNLNEISIEKKLSIFFNLFSVHLSFNQTYSVHSTKIIASVWLKMIENDGRRLKIFQFYHFTLSKTFGAYLSVVDYHIKFELSTLDPPTCGAPKSSLSEGLKILNLQIKWTENSQSVFCNHFQ